MTNRVSPQPRASILIILMGSLGDLTRGLCVASAIKSQRPDIKLSWLVEPRFESIVRAFSEIDEVIVFRREWNFLGVWPLYRELRKRHFDICLDLQRHFKSGFFSFLSAAKRRIGFNAREAKEFNSIFNNEHIEFVGFSVPKILHYLKFVEALGLQIPEHPLVDASKISLSADGEKLRQKMGQNCVALVLGSAWETKDWIDENYVALCRLIRSSFKQNVLLIGDLSKKALAERLQAEAQDDGIINAIGKTKVTDLFPLLGAAKLAVGPDSGPGHIAATVGTPYISLFGPTSPERTAPFGYADLVLQSDAACRPCYKRKCPGLGKICMRLISVEMVAEKMRSLLEGKKI